MSRRHSSSPRAALGLSLIELMIAMVIGVILLLGLVQVMSASRSAYQLSTGVARTQENARFAMDFLQRDLRMAGHMGCVNDQAHMAPERPSASDATREGLNLWFLTNAQRNSRSYNALAGDNFLLRFDLGMQGFEAVSTGPNESINLAAGTPVAGNANQWSPALPTILADLNPIAGSDIVVVRYLSRDGVLSTLTQTSASEYTIRPEAYGSTVSTTGSTGFFGLADCKQASVFAASGVDAGGQVTVELSGLNGSGMREMERSYTSTRGQRPMLYRAEGYVYYVAAGVGTNVDGTRPPSLYRARILKNGNGVRLDAEELVEGVESLQLLYGMDENLPNDLPRGNVRRTRVASAVNATPTSAPNNTQSDEWRRVGSVQVGLLMRSADRAASSQARLAPRVLGVQARPPADDTFYRSVYETTAVMRNRLFGN